MLLSVVSLIIVLGVLVFVHEAGHFVAAKWAGIYVHRFSLGLGTPIRALSFRRGETEYAVSWLPLGGYVKMASLEEQGGSTALEGGDVEVEVPADRVFEAKPVWKRIVVILAGVTMNVLLAWLIYSGLALEGGRSYQPTTTVGDVATELLPKGAEALGRLRPGDRIVRVGTQPVHTWEEVVEGLATAGATRIPVVLATGDSVVLDVHPDALEQRYQLASVVAPYLPAIVDTVLAGSPAAAGGMRGGDTLVAADGRPLPQWYDLVRMLDTTRAAPVVFTVGRAGGRVDLTVHPRLDTIPAGAGDSVRVVGRIGVGPHIETRTEPYGVGGAMRAGLAATWGSAGQIFRSLRGMVTGRISGRQIGGPILIAQQAGQMARLGIREFLTFMALISVNLAVLNMLPIPVLDGGQFLFLVAEGVTRRPVPTKLREHLTTVGLLLILSLMLFAFWNDFMRLFRAWGWVG